ncbi:sensor histidine kinase [Variovorax sp. PCZ-1]|uniref:sensor histidine kinase n=1 Tax=Variovorax sp. PCZ-1 TaxID=2835533 RepID=UPI001BCDF96A|nr:sensor histidine kinase [Variovorax sp. PCZ-1]MBS7808903.1 sensor histidine kinase N-terminal domain-containing protein [Variovorax sp. PCZ-1]
MLTPLLIVWPASLILTWLVAQGIAGGPFDRALEYNTQALSQLVSVSQGKAVFNLPQPAREILRADEDDLVYYQVLGLRGEHLSGERDLPLPPEDDVVETGRVKLRDDEFRGEEVRIAWLYTRTDLSSAGSKPILIQVAETREKRSRLATEIVKGVMLPQFIVLPLAVLLVWLALARGIRPLHELEERIRARRPDDLSPIDTQAVPQEVAPLVNSVNDLFGRERQSLAAQRRFLADAAHQLKTPLAGLRMQAELALRAQASEADLKQSLKQISRASMNATRTVNQLLALARAEGSGQSLPKQNVHVAQLAQEVVREALPRAMERHFDLGYEGLEADDPAAQIQGYPALLAELVRNLVDNALAYVPSTPERSGVITLRVLASDSGQVLLQVEDNGPGIPEGERELVLQPFYRRLGQEADGSGLGLAIVAEIAKRHGAQLVIEDAHARAEMPGVRFSLRLTRHPF